MGRILAFFESYFEYAKTLSPEQRLAFYDAITGYAFDGEEPSADNPAHGAFCLVRPGLDKSLSASERGRAGGIAGRGTSRNAGNSNAAKQKQNNSKTIAKNNSKTIAENNTQTIAKTIAEQNEDGNEDDNTRSNERVKNAPARARIEPDFLRNAAAQLGIPRDFADEFEEIMKTQDWAYINPAGRTVPVTLGNVKTVMGCFWKREKERRGDGGVDSIEGVSRDELKAILARTRK